MTLLTSFDTLEKAIDERDELLLVLEMYHIMRMTNCFHSAQAILIDRIKDDSELIWVEEVLMKDCHL